MTPFLSKKTNRGLLAGAWLLAAATVLLLAHALSGPRLGALYDFLLALRRPPPVSREILVLDANEVMEPGDAFIVTMALTELGASGLIVEVPILGTRPGITESPAELTDRIDGEFYLITRNTRALFDAIRLGLMEPEDAPGFVEGVVDLAERGRDRLNAAILRQEEEGSVRLALAEAAFAASVTAADLRSGGARSDPFSRPVRDPDGRLRRMAPVILAEGGSRGEDGEGDPAHTAPEIAARHVAFRALEGRWRGHSVASADLPLGRLTELTVEPAHLAEESAFRFRLDADGALLFERPGRNDPFRRIGLDAFAEYDRAERAMSRLLTEAWNLNLHGHVRPEGIPLILLERTDALREELLGNPGDGSRAAWIAARRDFLHSLDDFLYGPSEMLIVNEVDVAIDSVRNASSIADGAAITEGTDSGDDSDNGAGSDAAAVEALESETAALQARRDEVIRTFVAMRGAQSDLVAARGILAEAVEGALVIMAPSPGEGGEDSSALLANALLTGTGVTPARPAVAALWSLGAALVMLTLVHALGSSAFLPKGIAAAALCLAAFSAAFVLSGRWIDPAIPATAVLLGTLFVSLSRLFVLHRRLLRFHRGMMARERWMSFHFGGNRRRTPG